MWTQDHTTIFDTGPLSRPILPIKLTRCVEAISHNSQQEAENMVEQLAVPNHPSHSLQEVVQGLDDTQLAASLRAIDTDQVHRIIRCLRGNRRLDQNGSVILFFQNPSLFGDDIL